MRIAYVGWAVASCLVTGCQATHSKGAGEVPVAAATAPEPAPSRPSGSATGPAHNAPAVVSRRVIGPAPASPREGAPRSASVPLGTALAAPRSIPQATAARGASPAPATLVATTCVRSRRPLNATCPVMVGNPIDARFTSVWKGQVVAFCDGTAKAVFDVNPVPYEANLPTAPGSVEEGIALLVRAPAGPAAAPAPAQPVSQPAPPAGIEASAEGDCEDCADGHCRVPGR